MNKKKYGATGRDLHIDVPLTNVAMNYRPTGMIAADVAPIVPVGKQSDLYYVWTMDAFRTEDDIRAPATEAKIVTREVGSDTFFCHNYALKDRIPYEDIENADAGMVFAERSSRVEYIMDKLTLGWENRLATQVTTTSGVGSGSNVASAWDGSGSDPVGDIETAIYNVEDRWGIKPNSIIFGRAAWRLFRVNSSVVTRLYGHHGTGTSPRYATRDSTKAIFEVDRVLVGGAYRNTAEQGLADSIASVWGDHVLIYYAPMQPRRDIASFMYTFRWNRLGNLTSATVRDKDEIGAEEVEVNYYQDERVTASGLGYLISFTGSSQ